MATPVHFPNGIAAEPQKSVLADFPVGSGTPRQLVLVEDFTPYRAADYTVTTAVAGAASQLAFPGGGVKLANSASATDTIYLLRLGAGLQALQGNKFWMDFQVAYPRAVLNSNDTDIYLGWFDTVDPPTAPNGIYFIKPKGGTAVHFVIKKATVVTTFQNIADLSLPSGLYGDANAVNGTLNVAVAGNVFTSVAIKTAGAGYRLPPLVLSTAASGSAGNIPVSIGLGSTALNQGNPQLPVISSGLPYASLYAPFVVTPGSGYTNNAGPIATYLEVEPIINLQAYFDGKGKLIVGVNGRAVLSILGTATEKGVVGIAAGGTADVSAGISPSYYSTTQLTSLIAPVQPPVGSPANLFPMTPLNVEFGVTNSTVNVRTFYVLGYRAAVEV